MIRVISRFDRGAIEVRSRCGQVCVRGTVRVMCGTVLVMCGTDMCGCDVRALVPQYEINFTI